jgi:hypothetical protein
MKVGYMLVEVTGETASQREVLTNQIDNKYERSKISIQ